MERTALYIRVSSIDQVRRGVSIPDQLARLRCEARNAGATIVAEFIDQARSGTSAAKRPDYQRLLAAARRRAFDCVRVESVDRGHRNDTERRQFETEMQALGIRVIYSGEAEQQAPQYRKFNRGIRGVVAELEADETSDRTYKRHLYRAKQGKWRGGNIPFGVQPDGQGWFLPDPATYDLLLWILERRADGLGYHRIAKLLNGGIQIGGDPQAVPPTPGLLAYQRRPYLERQDPETGDIIRLDRRLPDGRWKPQMIARICQGAVSGVYAGILHWGARFNRFAEYDSDGKPKEAVQVDTGRPLVDRELLARVQLVELSVSGNTSTGPRIDNRYVLTTMVRCGMCGRAMHGYTTSRYKAKKCYKYRKYRCAGRSNRPGACTMTILGAAQLEQVVLATIFAETSRVAPRALLAALNEAAARRRTELTTALEVLSLQHQELAGRRDEALDALVQTRDLSDMLRRALRDRAEATITELVTIEGQQQILRAGLDSLDAQTRSIEQILRQPNLDPARWEEPSVNAALQRALHIMVRRIEVLKVAQRNYTVKIWLPDAINWQFSEIVTHESAWGSNPPAKLVTPPTRFEDEDSHRATSALGAHCSRAI
jgi:DNA invertase Pin-like site-specific DNA recombinase